MSHLVSGNLLAIPLPIIASNPYFLDADRSVQEAVQGLIPNEDLHRSYMEIEPITGSKDAESKEIRKKIVCLMSSCDEWIAPNAIQYQRGE